MQIFTNANFNFIRWRWHAIILSLVVIAAGAVVMATRGLPLGIDFSGGTSILVQGANESEVRRALDPMPGEKVIQQFDDPAKQQVMLRLPQIEGDETEGRLERQSQEIEQRLKTAGLNTTIIRRELVGPVI